MKKMMMKQILMTKIKIAMLVNKNLKKLLNKEKMKNKV